MPASARARGRAESRGLRACRTAAGRLRAARCDQRSGGECRDEWEREPAVAPAVLAHDAEQRHARRSMPRAGRRAPRRASRVLSSRRDPFGRGKRPRGGRHSATPTPTGTCATASRAKLGAAALASEPSASSAEAASNWRPETELPGYAPEQQRGDAGGEAGDRAQLACGGRRDMQVVRGLCKHRRHRDQRRLACEQAGEEGDAHRPVSVAIAVRRARQIVLLSVVCSQQTRKGGTPRLATSQGRGKGRP